MSTCGDQSGSVRFSPFPSRNAVGNPPKNRPKRFCTSSSSRNGFHFISMLIIIPFCWRLDSDSLKRACRHLSESVQILCSREKLIRLACNRASPKRHSRQGGKHAAKVAVLSPQRWGGRRRSGAEL